MHVPAVLLCQASSGADVGLAIEAQPTGFDLGPVPLLGWLPDETLFSQCSRQHEFWGYAHSSATASILFGGRRAGTQHDLPSHLDRFAVATGERLGSSRAVAEERTLLRYYRPFVSDGEHKNAIVAMRSTSVAHLKYRLGLLTSRFRANHPLKACRRCLRGDVQRHGWPYWHLEHQYPGVWICLTHDHLLEECVVKSTGVDRFQWVLPSASLLADRGSAPPRRTVERLKSLASMIVETVRASAAPGWLSSDRMREVLLLSIRKRGWSTATGQLRLRNISREFLDYCDDLVGVQELRSFPRTIDDAAAQVGRLLRPMRTGTHPLRYLTLADWLYPSFSEFLEALSAEISDPSPVDRDGMQGSATPFRSDIRKGLKQSVIGLLRAGVAVTAAANQTGIDVVTAMAWAAQEGISISRRPSVLKPDLHRKLIRQLEKGADKKVVADRCGISESSVNRILRTEVGLHRRWRAARENASRSMARASWLRALKLCRGRGVKLVRAMEPSAYAWLYRNDRAWLEEHSPSRSTPNGRTGHRVLWDSRDRDLKAQVQIALLELAQGDPSRTIRLWEVYQRVPELKAKLHQLDRLPLSRKALDSAIRAGRRLRR